MKPLAVALCVSALGLSLSVVGEYPAASHQGSSTQRNIGQSIDAWEHLVSRLRTVPDKVRFQQVNQFFNSIRFRSDQKTWGKEDYWALPSEFLSRGIGDCEDYAIAKYITLRRLGIPDSRLRLAYVRSLTLRQAHMVLLVETEDGDQIVLDNLTSDMKAPERRNDLDPVYSFNSTGLWLLGDNYQERRIGHARRLPHWKAAQDRSANRNIWPES